MGQISDFFLASAAEFRDLLSGWQHPPPPLDEPVEREFFNPFKNEVIRIKSRLRLPRPDPHPDGALFAPVRKLPCLQWKNIDAHVLSRIRSEILGVDFETASQLTECDALIGPEGTGDVIYAVPDAVTAALERASPQDLEGIARTIAEALSKDYTGLYGSWNDYLELLEGLRDLAKLAIATDRRIYLWRPGESSRPYVPSSKVFANDVGVVEETEHGSLVTYTWEEIETISSFLRRVQDGRTVVALRFDSVYGDFIEFWSIWPGFELVAGEIAARLRATAGWRAKVEASDLRAEPVIVWDRKT